jgi:hypothetical protein
LIGAVGVFQLVAIQRENVNWDEFALLGRASETVRTGAMQGGGRPGLAVLVLVPFVSDCESSVDAVVAARHLWVGFNLAALIGLACLVRRFTSSGGALLAVALVCLLPAWMRWALQVRTDQPAVAAALWGGVALLASRERPRLSLVAGVLVGTGYLFTQKALYVTGLIGALAAADLLVRPGLLPRREGLRLLGVAAGAAAVVGAYKLLLPLLFVPPRALTLEGGLATMAYYRATFGYRAYRAMLPTLLPHLALGALLLAATADAAIRRTEHRRTLLAAWAVAALGAAVGWFHAATFPYFWITLGLFPAAAVAVGWPAIAETLARHLPRLGPLLVVAIAGALLWRAGTTAARNLGVDGQRPQRESLAFIARNFPPTAHGFHAESALFCRREPEPFPNYFSERIVAMKDADVRWLLDEMRRRPVVFVMAHRLLPFPRPIQEYWASHYVRYRAEVLIPGRFVSGAAGAAGTVEIVVPGRYRWWPLEEQSALLVDGQVVGPRETVELDVGMHHVSLTGPVRSGILAIDLADEPRPGVGLFYDPAAIEEIAPRRMPRWW